MMRFIFSSFSPFYVSNQSSLLIRIQISVVLSALMFIGCVDDSQSEQPVLILPSPSEMDQTVNLNPLDPNAPMQDMMVAFDDLDLNLNDMNPPRSDLNMPTQDMEVISQDMEVISQDMDSSPVFDMALPMQDMELPGNGLDCVALCETYSSYSLDGCNEDCQPIAPELCTQQCNPTYTQKAWSEPQWINLNTPYTRITSSNSGFVVDKGNQNQVYFEIWNWEGTLIHTIEDDSWYTYVMVSDTAILIYMETDLFQGQATLYDWNGTELERLDIVQSAGYDERLPTLFNDQIYLRTTGYYNDEWGYMSTYASNLIQVSVDQDYDYYDYVSEIDFSTTELRASYLGFDTLIEDELITSNTDGYVSFSYPIYSLSDHGFIYEDEQEIYHLVLAPNSEDAPWSIDLLSTWIAPELSNLTFPFNVNDGLYGLLELDGQSHLYKMRFEGQSPQDFEFIRAFDEQITDLKSDHMIMSREGTGIWVRHRLPACTGDGQCACLTPSTSPLCSSN